MACLTCLSSAHALGPNQLSFNGMKFYKSDERTQNNVRIAEYEAVDGNNAASIVLTHVLDKNDPSKIATGLKQKKSIEVMDVENVKPDSSDVMVTFVKFDMPNLKVENNLCRIIKSPAQNGSIVFQYVEKKKLKSQAEGATIPDFTVLAENLKELPIDQYVSSLSQTRSETASYHQPARRVSNSNIPWYKRPGARTGTPQSYRRY